LGFCRGGPPQGVAACGPVDAGPRNAAAVAAAAAVSVAAATVDFSADVNVAEAAAVAAVVPSHCLCERQLYC